MMYDIPFQPYTDTYGQVVKVWALYDVITADVLWVFEQGGIQIIPHPPEFSHLFLVGYLHTPSPVVTRGAWYEFETRSEKEEFILKLKFGDSVLMTSQRWAPMEY